MSGNTTRSIQEADDSIVLLDVSGKIFRVARSTLLMNSCDGESTMLARMVSDTWMSTATTGKEENNNELKPIFIDRDSERFAYILDYLRYNEVTLPKHVTRSMFMKDLDYFGIAVPYEDSVKVETNPSIFSAAGARNYKAALSLLPLAHECLTHFVETSASENTLWLQKDDMSDEQFFPALHLLYENKFQEKKVMNEILHPFGLKLRTQCDNPTDPSSGHCEIRFDPI